MSGRLRIRGGRVHDPANGIDGEIRDICIEEDRIVESLPDDAPVLDARGLVVMPGGVDIHSHIAGATINAARRLSPETRRDDVVSVRPVRDGHLRSGTGGIVPSSFVTGYRYAGMGYTAAFEAAIPPLGARQAHQELNDTPMLDKGFYVLLGNDRFLFHLLDTAGEAEVREQVARTVEAARAYAVKVVNPGGIAAWQAGAPRIGLEDVVPGTKKVTPRRVVRALADAVDALGLPHPLHVHGIDLGMAGNATAELDLMRAVEDRRTHLAHLQFHSYGSTGDGRPTSRAPELIEYVNEHSNLSCDVGQIIFGPATAATADARVAEMLHHVTGHRWVDLDIELDGGCSVVPFNYREKNYTHALQWACALEMFLLSRDPWRVVLSMDHPNGGSFLAYPRLARLLMDRTFRDAEIARANQRAIAGTALADGLDREYTLNDIAIITRAGPARLLGLTRKGHLGAGADADVALYDPAADVEVMFAAPRYVLKGGERVVEDGTVVRETFGRTVQVRPGHGEAIERAYARFVTERGTVAADQYRVDEDELRRAEVVATAG